jgi:hypothetical protein
MKLVLVAALALLVVAFKPLGDKPVVDKTEAKSAYLFLNKVRGNISAYVKELKLPADIKINSKPLMWNDTLAKVAETKALDMATRNYFAHVDPDGYGINYFMNKAGYKLPAYYLTSKSDNYFESLAAEEPDGIAAIKDLIIDAGEPTLGHRKHLLGIESYGGYVDIGIGFVRCAGSGSRYSNYISVIIATH